MSDIAVLLRRAGLLTASAGQPLDVDVPEWMGEAVCASVDPDLWFPEKGGVSRRAASICRACPVVADCLSFALALDANPYGVWGATTQEQRSQMRGDIERPDECKRGHEFTPENTYNAPAGGRYCRTCMNARQAKRVRAA